MRSILILVRLLATPAQGEPIAGRASLPDGGTPAIHGNGTDAPKSVHLRHDATGSSVLYDPRITKNALSPC